MTSSRDTTSSPGERAFGRRFVAPLFMGSMLNPVNSSLIATALVPIAHSLHIGVGKTVVLVSGLYLASAIAQPTAGTLSEQFGPRRVFFAGITLVMLGGIVGGVAHSLAELLVARVLIGVGTSAGYPSAMLIIRRRATDAGLSQPPGGVLGGLQMAGTTTAALGLPLGGVLVDALGWRATFLINVPVAAATLALAAAAILWAALVAWELRARRPFIDLRLLAGNLALTRTYLRFALTSLCVYTVLYGLTQWIEVARDVSSRDAGLLLLPMTGLSALLVRPLSSRNLVRGPLIVASAASAAGSLGILALSTGTATAWILVITLVFGVTLGSFASGNQTALYTQASADQIGTAAGLLRTFGYIGSIASSALIAIVFHSRVSDHGLHSIGLIMTGVSLLALAFTVADRTLRRPRPHDVGEEKQTYTPAVTTPPSRSTTT